MAAGDGRSWEKGGGRGGRSEQRRKRERATKKRLGVADGRLLDGRFRSARQEDSDVLRCALAVPTAAPGKARQVVSNSPRLPPPMEATNSNQSMSSARPACASLLTARVRCAALTILNDTADGVGWAAWRECQWPRESSRARKGHRHNLPSLTWI